MITPMTIKMVGRMIETAVLRDLKVAKAFLINTALYCFPNVYRHSTFGRTRFSMSGMLVFLSYYSPSFMNASSRLLIFTEIEAKLSNWANVSANLWAWFIGSTNFNVFAAVCSSYFAPSILLRIICRHSFIRDFVFFFSLKLITTWQPTLNFSLMKFESPTITNFPSDIIPILCDSYSASSRWCVVRMRHRFYERILFSMSQMPWREFGSSPEVGSSRNIIFEFPINAFAKDSFLLFPPDKFLESFPLSLFSAHSDRTYSIFLSISWVGIPLILA